MSDPTEVIDRDTGNIAAWVTDVTDICGNDRVSMEIPTGKSTLTLSKDGAIELAITLLRYAQEAD